MEKPIFLDKPMDFAMYWLGHSNAIIELDGKRILIDPVFDNAFPLPFIISRYGKAPISRQELPPLDYVIITHNHYDHLERKTIQHIKDAHFIVPLGLGTTLRGWGVDGNIITEIGWHESFTDGKISITALPSMHYSRRGLWDNNKTLWASYAIKSNNKNIFWGGDTGYGKHIEQIGEKYGPFDIAALEMDAWNKGWPNMHLFPKEVAQAAEDLHAKYILPIHWGVFDLGMHPWDESIGLVLEEAKKKNIPVLTPKMGERVDENNLPMENWWR